jgi:hypothetical protein
MKKTCAPKPPQEQFAKMPRDLLRGDAWRSLGINERRVIDFLLIEHMSKGGRENGKLKAPYRQLVHFGVSARRTAKAIAGAEARGLIVCRRGGMRVATVYTIAWLPLPDGSMPAQAWREFRDPSLLQFKNLPEKLQAGLPEKLQADGPKLPEKLQADGSEYLPEKGKALSRRGSNQTVEAVSLYRGENPARPDAVPPARRAAAGGRP